MTEHSISSNEPALAFLGVGRMGSRMARRLLDAGHQVRVYDPDVSASEAIAQHGALIGDNPADACEGAQLVLCSLPGPDAVHIALVGPNGALSGATAGATVVDMTTSDPETCRSIAASAEERGLRFLDAPVSRGVSGAENGTLAMLVGGDSAVLEEALPVLHVLATDVLHVGPVGAGQIAKLCNNMLAGIHAAALGEVLVAGVQAGIGLAELTQAIRASSGTSFILEHYFPNGLFTAERPTGFALSLMRKDLALFMRTSTAAGATVPVSAVVQQLYAAAAASGRADADWSSIAELYEDLTGVELRLPAGQRAEA